MMLAPKPTALVTGASGSIGSHLCRRLQELGWRVIGLSSKVRESGPWDRYLTADLAEKTVTVRLAGELAGETVSVVWHLAGKAHAMGELGDRGTEYERINVGGTVHMLELARLIGARRFVLASSIKAMGEGGHTILDENAPCAPSTPYGKSKLQAEREILRPGLRIEGVVLRFCMVYGGSDRGNMGRMVAAVRRHRFPPFPETANRRSFVYIADAVEACVLAGVKSAAAGEIFLVTDGQLYSTRRLYHEMCRAVKRPVPHYVVPLWILRTLAKAGDLVGALLRRRAPLDSDTLAKLTESSAYSCDKIRRTLGYQPQWPLSRGLEQIAGQGKENP